MNFIQIQGASINPRTVHNIVSCEVKKRPLICVNFCSPLADVSFLFKNNEERDSKFNDIRKRLEG